MSNDDIALSFDTAEYYNLQEACDYLNRKYKTDSITTKKLIKRIYEFSLDIYVYGRGFSLMGTHYLDVEKLNFLDKLDESSEEYKTYINHIDLYLFHCDFKPSLFCKEKGVFLQLSRRNIAQLLFLNRTEISDDWTDIKGLLQYDNINADPCNVEVFLNPCDIPSTYQGTDYDFNRIKIVDSSYTPIISKDDIEEIGLQESLDKVNLTVREHHHFDDVQIEYYEGTNTYFNNKETVALTLEITTDDILILHKDLVSLASYIIKNKPAIEKTEIILRKKGVSPRLLKARIIADAHAQYLWSKDHDKKIRIGEMCELVWSYLIDTEHGEMLPERKSTLKNWLSSIPQYAREAGRPPS